MGCGLFIVFEGGDSTGKSSQVNALAKALELSQVSHLVTREPGSTPEGEKIRSLLLDIDSDLDDRCEALLYAADKAQHVTRVVKPALEAGQVVICDRYIDSMLAYQGTGRGMDMAALTRLTDWATRDLRPDLTVVLDADPQIAVFSKTGKDRLEAAGLDFHRRVRQGFLDLAEADPSRYLVLPALVSLRGTAALVCQRVGELLGQDLAIPDLHEPAPRGRDGTD